MILVGNSRAGGQNLAHHLMSAENERVSVHDVSGFASNDLNGAFKEAEAVSRGTRCKKYLYSLSLNPPANESVEVDVFEGAITKAEQTLGLTGQPRAVVFHEKKNDKGELRRHCHVVWSRIDTDNMRAIPMDYSKLKLRDLAKELYLEHEWDMPAGFIDPKLRDPKTLTLAEWQQAKRFGQDPREVKAVFQDSWERSDSKEAFANALKEHGLMLARGNRRGFVATDMHGKVYPVARWTGLKTKEVKARLGNPKDLPSLEAAKEQLADRLSPAVQRIQREEQNKLDALKAKQEQDRADAKAKAEAQRRLQKEWQAKREAAEEKQRKERFNKGARGLVDRVTRRHAKTKESNALEAFRKAKRDTKQRDALILKQQDTNARLKALQAKAQEKPKAIQQSLTSDLHRLKALRDKAQSTNRLRELGQSQSKPQTPSRARDGPEP